MYLKYVILNFDQNIYETVIILTILFNKNNLNVNSILENSNLEQNILY